MKRGLVFVLTVGLTGVVHARDNSIEVTLQDAPQDQQAQLRTFESWRRKSTMPQDVNSDANGVQWRYKFAAGSDKCLGRAADTGAIRALVPVTIPPTIRWVSRSVVVVSSGCHFDSSPKHRLRCLYVFEKHGSKWQLTHHYRWPPPWGF